MAQFSPALTHNHQHLVVLVCDKPHPRIAKIGYGLKYIGCRVVLLHRDALPSDNPAHSFDETHIYHDPSEALNLAQQFRPIVFHVFSSWNFDTAAVFMKNKPGHIVFDDYDVISGVARADFIAANYPTILETERVCLENADGITCRDLLLQSTKRNFHYRISDKLLYLPDCCWGDFDSNLSQGRGIDPDYLHVVYAGNMAIEKHAASAHPRDNFYFLDFAKDITAAGIHLHIYPSQSFTADFENTLSEYLELAVHTPFFHVHRPLPADRLIQEISDFDMGLLSMWKETQNSNKAYLPVIFSHSTSNKLFDYMDAGLGIITCDALRFQRWFLREQKICISAYLEDVRGTLLSSPLSFWRGLRSRVRQARNRFSAKLHAKRLLVFYEAVSSQRNNMGLKSCVPVKGEHLTLAQHAFQQGEIDEAIFETKLELQYFPNQPDTQRFLSFVQTYSRKLERMS